MQCHSPTHTSRTNFIYTICAESLFNQVIWKYVTEKYEIAGTSVLYIIHVNMQRNADKCSPVNPLSHEFNPFEPNGTYMYQVIRSLLVANTSPNDSILPWNSNP